MPAGPDRTLADGQLAALAAALLEGAANLAGGAVSLVCSNTSGGSSETVTITFKRAGGTARRIARAVLAANETLVVHGIQLEAGDTLLGAATDAATVDYLVTGESQGPYEVYTLDANGSRRQVNSGVSGNQTITGNLTVQGDTTPVFSAASADGAVTQKSGVVLVTKGTAAALTIADPTATTDDGKTLAVVSTTAAAHTLSNAAGSGFNAGGAASDVGTFGGARGDNIVLIAYQGKWYVQSKVNVTLG